MDLGWLAAIITGIVSLIALFFGRSYWQTLQSMISDQDEEVKRLQRLASDNRDRLDDMERKYYDRSIELERCLSAVDNYATSNQLLLNENQALRKENNQLKRALAEFESQSSP